MDYAFSDIEQKWQKRWAKEQTFAAQNKSDKPKYYVLDMFPYPSGAGLHVGHPLGYIASDIYARFKRHQGYNVLHPMGYDAFGLPAEQYAIQTGQHPAVTTTQNIKRYREQLDQIGFSFDWSRQVKTSDPEFYRWTQWIFVQLFHSWYNRKTNKAEPISTLKEAFERNGNADVDAPCHDTIPFTADQWNAFSDHEKREVLLNYRLAYRAESVVNWCPALGTVLANDEVVNGVSERGGHLVEQKKMMQWSLRITAYAQRLLDGLNTIDWTDSLKDIQRNWIGRSEGGEIEFQVDGAESMIRVFTTRPDTIFGATFMVLAPEHELVSRITTHDQKEEVERYLDFARGRSERERMAQVKDVTGAFTGAYANNPVTGKRIPIWISDYVLAGYGTGAIMAVPAGDERDWDFAQKFNLPIIPVIEGQDVSEGADDRKDGIMINSGFLNGKTTKEAIQVILHKVEEMGIGQRKVNYKLRDAVFSRQRYWGEPFPIYYRNDIPYTIDEDKLDQIRLPEIDNFKPTETGDPPLGRATHWNWDREAGKIVENGKGFPMDLNTMPGWAGSNWYYLRYMMEGNKNERHNTFVSPEAVNYWQQVDLYMGGAEHATGHLLYFRFITKFLNDLGFIPFDEPAKKLINQGMIQGISAKVYQLIVVRQQAISEGYEVESADTSIPEFYVDAALGERIESDTWSKEEQEHVQDFLNGVVQHLKEQHDFQGHLTCTGAFKEHVPVSAVDEAENTLDVAAVSKHYGGALIQSVPNMDGNTRITVVRESEKMSKSKLNVVTPDEVINAQGADALRLHEMFLGPIEMHKPWNTKGIDGVSRFLRKLWRLYHDDQNTFSISDEAPSKDELKALHKCIQKVSDDMEKFSFNTSVSAFMIAVNELTDLGCNKRQILEPLTILVSCHAPHIAEELWELLGHSESVSFAAWPKAKQEYLKDDNVNYPVSFNGKTRYHLELSTDLSKEAIEKEVLTHEQSQKWLEGRVPKKVIVVPGRIVNVVV